MSVHLRLTLRDVNLVARYRLSGSMRNPLGDSVVVSNLGLNCPDVRLKRVCYRVLGDDAERRVVQVFYDFDSAMLMVKDSGFLGLLDVVFVVARCSQLPHEGRVALESRFLWADG